MLARNPNRELWLAFSAILLITLGYLFVVILAGSIPAASNFFGHSLGILGFILMLATETLYTWRKRSQSARWGRMADWLQFHIFTGLVGPYLVLLHTSWKFNGLAGVVTLLTGVTVASGFIGRFIYTAVPRSADGAALEALELERLAADGEGELQAWLASRPVQLRSLSAQLRALEGRSESGGDSLISRTLREWQLRWRLWRFNRHLDAETRRQARQIEKLLKRQRQIRRQLATLALARRLLSLWHTIHIPIGMALFAAAAIHIVAAIYYATLLHLP